MRAARLLPALVPLALARAPLLAAQGDAAASTARGDDPRAVVREATRAAEAGNAAPLRERWAARLRADSTDRAATLGLATIARLTYDYADAGRRYRRLFEGGAPAADPFAVYARLGLAQGQDAHGFMRGQEELLKSARDGARAARDDVAEGEALFWQSQALASVYGAGFAIAKVDSALRVLPESAAGVRAASRCRRTQVLAMVGAPGVTDSLTAASAYARRSGDPTAQAVCLRAAGVFRHVHGFLDSALATYDSLAALRRRMHDRSGLAFALGLTADGLRGRGDVGGALRAINEALVEARASRNLYMEATLTLGLGGIALTLNDHVSAERNVRQAVAAFEAAEDSGSATQARAFLPFVSLAAGDYGRARREVDAVLPATRQGGDWAQVEELYKQLSVIEMRSGDAAAAGRAFDSAAAAAHHLGPARERALHFPRGRLALYRGDLAAAGREFTTYLAGLDSVQRMERYETRAYLADVYARRGDLARAERELTAAGDELDAWRAGLADAALRTLVFQAGATEANDRNASVARVLAALARGGRADAAFTLAERRRARELTERLARTRALRAAPAGGDSAARLTIAASATANVPARATTAATTAAAVAAAIPDGRTAILEYVTGVLGAPTTLFVVTRGSMPDGEAVTRAYVLPPADSLVDDVARLVALVESGDPRTPARTLGARLLDSALAALAPGVTRLVVVPDGPLHRVPWDLLRLSDGRYVAERYAVSVAPSATLLVELWRRDPAEPRRRPVRLLAYGDPAFASEHAAAFGADAESYRSAFDSSGGLPRLRASADEAELVARYADSAVVRLRDDASAAYLEHEPLSGFRILHFATHAIVDDRSMTRTALALAPGGGESGFVGAADLAALALDADLVVLSACRSAGGVVVDGEGVQGLTAPLLEAGARAVVATGWRIGDRSTVRFVDDFYRAMARGLPVGDALRAAKLDAIRRGAPPREWAAFTAVGDPLVVIPLRTPAPAVPRWAVALALLLTAAGLAAAWLRVRRRHGVDLPTTR